MFHATRPSEAAFPPQTSLEKSSLPLTPSEDFLPTTPSPPLCDRASFRLSFEGYAAGSLLLDTLERRFPIRTNVLEGSLRKAGERYSGSLTIELSGAREAIESARRWLEEEGVCPESLRPPAA